MKFELRCDYSGFQDFSIEADDIYQAMEKCTEKAADYFNEALEKFDLDLFEFVVSEVEQ